MNAIARLLLIVGCALGGTAMALAQPPAPPAPTKYRVMLRYAIPAARNEHVVQYDSLIRHLQGLNFEFIPPLNKHPDSDREDRTKNYLEGDIAGEKALKLLDHSAVQTLLLRPIAPEEFKLPDDPNAPVVVRLELAGNLPPDRQRTLANQTRVLLRELGFKEPIGYDHRGISGRPYTRMVGTIPKAKLDLLQRDLRSHPAGWIGPVIPYDEIPSPLREVNPVRVIEILPDTQAIKQLAEPEMRFPDYLDKISADLWELVKDKDVTATSIRIQVGFAGAIMPEDTSWKLMLREATPGFFIEGQLGQFVTGVIRLDQVKRLASVPYVSLIRLPRAPMVEIDPAVKIKGDNARALAQSGVTELHARGQRGQGVRVAIVDRDFRGWERLVQDKKLPAKTRLVDLTTERNPDIYPLPHAGADDQFGHGTLCAQAAALAAPDAELVLVRIDVGDPYHLDDVARYIQGGRYSNLIEQRNGELVAHGARLKARREVLLEERRIILEDFTDEADLREKLGFLGPVFAWLYSDREWHRLRMEYHDRLEEEHRAREERFRGFLKEVSSLKDVPIVVNSYAWSSGYPLGSMSPLSKSLDIPPSPLGRGAGDEGSPLWFQAIGNTRGQSWFGLFQNTPGDPAMKFVPDGSKLPKGRWSNELNFLSWQPWQGDAKAELPAKAMVRLTLQWREPHDPDYYLRPGFDDEYRKPLANLRVQLLRQRDPDHKKVPADAFDLIGRTTGVPQRLEHLPSGSVYEHVLEAPLEEAGRYAVRIEKQVDSVWLFLPHAERGTPIYRLLEGLTPTGIRPLGAPTLPALEKQWELRTRIHVEILDDANRLQGRAAFADFATDAGSIGLPADARNVVSVGAASFKDRPQPYSAFGSPVQMELARRPWLYAYDELELAGGGAFGTSIANAFAAGTTAAMMSGNVTRSEIVQILREQDGRVLRAPAGKK
jgi:hypothetical protein